MYYDRLIEANTFTKSIGLAGCEIPISTGSRHLDSPDFFPRIGKYINIDEPNELIAKCNIVSEVIRKVIEAEIGCKAYLTIGDVVFDDAPYFNIDQEYVKTLTRSGKNNLDPQQYHHHAWITLDSMEVIDFTLNTSMALLSKDLSKEMRMKMLGGVLSGHADELKHGVIYQPVLVGEEFYNEYDAVYGKYKDIYLSQLESKGVETYTRFVSAD